MSEVLDLPGAAEYLKLAQSTLYKYVRRGSVPAFKMGKVWRFKKEMLDEWMRKQTETHTEAITQKHTR